MVDVMCPNPTPEKGLGRTHSTGLTKPTPQLAAPLAEWGGRVRLGLADGAVQGDVLRDGRPLVEEPVPGARLLPLPAPNLNGPKVRLRPGGGSGERREVAEFHG